MKQLRPSELRGEAARQRAEKELKELREKLEAGGQEHEGLAARLQAAEAAAAAHQAAQSEIAELRRQKEELSAAHDRLREESTQAQTSLASSQALLVAGERERAELREKLNQLASQGAELAAALAAVESQQQRLSKLQSQLESVSTERDSLRINNGHALAELNELRAESQRQKEELDRQWGEKLQQRARAQYRGDEYAARAEPPPRGGAQPRGDLAPRRNPRRAWRARYDALGAGERPGRS